MGKISQKLTLHVARITVLVSVSASVCGVAAARQYDAYGNPIGSPIMDYVIYAAIVVAAALALQVFAVLQPSSIRFDGNRAFLTLAGRVQELVAIKGDLLQIGAVSLVEGTVTQHGGNHADTVALKTKVKQDLMLKAEDGRDVPFSCVDWNVQAVQGQRLALVSGQAGGRNRALCVYNFNTQKAHGLRVSVPDFCVTVASLLAYVISVLAMIVGVTMCVMVLLANIQDAKAGLALPLGVGMLVATGLVFLLRKWKANAETTRVAGTLLPQYWPKLA